MKIPAALRKETLRITIGVLIGDAVMIAAFALLKKLDYTVFLGALLGSVFTILNFLFLGLGIQKAMADPDLAQMRMRRSYSTRMLMMMAVMAVGVIVPYFNIVSVVVPFLLPNMIIKIMGALGFHNSEQEGGEIR